MKEVVKLSPPWITYYRELEQLFDGDAEVTVKFDEDRKAIKLYVNNTDKADALTKLLKPYQEFGNVTVSIEVYPSNMEEKTPIELMEIAFKGNKSLSKIKSVTDVFGNKINYVAFQVKVAQFYDDNLGDINGNKSMLYQDIAEDVFKEHDGIFFCTDRVTSIYF